MKTPRSLRFGLLTLIALGGTVAAAGGPSSSLSQLLQSPPTAGSPIETQGQYMGRKGICSGSSPRSSSDWMLQQGSNCIFVVGTTPLITRGTPVKVSATVRYTTDQRPYLVLTMPAEALSDG